MKRSLMGFLLLLLGVSLGSAYGQRHHSVSLTTNDNPASNDCQGHMQLHGSDFSSVVRDEESRSLPNQPLTIHAEHNGGIQVSSWDKADISIKLCKTVASSSDEEGRKLLSETKLDVNGSTVSVATPSSDGDYNLGTLLLVRAPKNADLKLTVQNGGISLNQFSGTAEAEAMNGGIALKHSTGKLTVTAQNGGVSIQDCSGDITAMVENGGLSIGLPQHWDGKGLEAHTQNGGLVISVPRNFDSGLEVTASEHVSIVCKGNACDNAQRTWEDGHRMLRLGNGPTLIHAKTVNGGIVIKDDKRNDAEL